MSSEPLLAFKAGRSHRREGTNFVDASPIKGAIYLYNEDGLLHLKWKNRLTNQVEEDLILFPQDASFSKVTPAPGGRTYVLTFSSSNQRHFFWMQDASPSRDDEFVANVNALLEDPDVILQWDTASSSSSSQPQASTSPFTSTGIPQFTPEQLARLQDLVTNMPPDPAVTQPTISLRDILTTENVAPLFTTTPELIPTLFPFLPADLPVPPSPETLRQIIASPQFQAAVRNLDQALNTGMLGGLVRGLGLPEEAGTGVLPFLRAIQDQARRTDRENEGDASSGQDRMETD